MWCGGRGYLPPLVNPGHNTSTRDCIGVAPGDARDRILLDAFDETLDPIGLGFLVLQSDKLWIWVVVATNPR